MPGAALPGPPPAGHHRPEIDGLRALAIAPVVIHHAAPALLPGGFAGVDIFFVISGYLITAIILRELTEGRFSLLAFWERRLRRIVPALAVMLWVTGWAGWAILTPEDFAEFGKALGSAAVFVSNIQFARGTGYFDGIEGSLPLLHTWTLGVEEQFYLLFPLMLLAAWQWQRRAVLPLVAVTGIASFALALWLAPRMPLVAFYALPTRMWELMLGAGCALLPRQPRANGWLAIAGLGLIALGFWRIGPWSLSPGAAFLLQTAGAALVLVFAREGTAVARALAWRPAVLLGLVSFGTYLWHQPVLAFLAYLWPGAVPLAAKGLAVILSLALAAASYRWIEQPVRGRRLLAARGRLALVCALALAVPLAAGAAAYARVLLPRSGAEATRLDGLQPPGVMDQVVIPPEWPLAFVLYGDSHAGQYFAALQERFGSGALVSQNGCLAAGGLSNKVPGWRGQQACDALPEQLAALVRARGVRTVVWAQRWERDFYARGSDRRLGSTTEPEGAALLLAAIERTRAALPPGTRIVLVGNSPTAWAAGARFDKGWLRCKTMVGMACPESYPETLAEGRAISATLEAFAKTHPGFAYVDAHAPLCPQGRCLIVADGKLNYWDGSHMTRRAARRVVGSIDPALLAADRPGGAILP